MVANALAGPVFGVGCMLWAIREVGNPGVVQAVVATATLVSVPFSRRLEGRILRPNYFYRRRPEHPGHGRPVCS